MYQHGPEPRTPFPATIQEIGCSIEEQAVLMIARYFFETFARPESQSWNAAFLAAYRYLPGRPDTEIALAVLRSIQEMGQVRKSGFTYSNPRCAKCSQKLSECERQFIGSLKALREGDRSAAHVNAMLLCEGGDFSGFLAALTEVNLLLTERRDERVPVTVNG